MRPLLCLWLLLLLLVSAPAALHAQATRIFVASFGSDANDGSRGAPKRNFQPAHDAVAAGGSIVVLDTAGYGALAITKSINVTVPPGVNGFITVTGSGSGITINSFDAIVSLRGLIIEGGGFNAGGRGIRVDSDATLFIEDCTVRRFNSGLDVLNVSFVDVYMHHCVVRDCGIGFNARPDSFAAFRARLSACSFERNFSIGVLATTAPPGSSGSSSATLSLADCVISGNSTGISSQNQGAMVRVSHCTLTGNLNGATTGGSLPGEIRSRGNNTLEGSPNGNTFPGTYTAK
jgi:hypothetical protein